MPVLLAMASAVAGACTADTHGAIVPAPDPPSDVLRVTVQRAPEAVITGTVAEVIVAVARDGQDAYRGAVNITLESGDPSLDRISAPPVHLDEVTSSAVLPIDVGADRKHGVVKLTVRANAESGSRTGTASVSTLIRGAPGALDTSFGQDGRLVLDDLSGEATATVIGYDGKILIAGTTGGGVGVVRLHPDGSRDGSFGANGVARLAIDALVHTSSITLDRDGYLVAGSAGAVTRGFVARFTNNGLVDTTFGTNGVRPISSQSLTTAMAMVDQGYFLAGRSATGGNGTHVVRLLPSGQADPVWAGDQGVFLGTSSTCSLGTDGCFATAMSPKGKDRLTVCESLGDGVKFHELVSGQVDPLYELTTSADVLSSCTSIFNNTPYDFWASGKKNAADFAIQHFKVSLTGGPLMVDPYWPIITMPSELGLGPSTCGLIGGAGFIDIVADATPADATTSAFAIVRLDAFGRFEPKFGDGKSYVTTFFGDTNAHSKAVLVVPFDGRLFVVGTNGHMIASRYWQ